MDEQPDAVDDPTQPDPYLVAQAARTHAQRAVENTRSLRSELAETNSRMWTREEHDAFSRENREADATARHRLNVLLTFSAIILGVFILLIWWFFWHLDTVDETTENRINEIVRVAGQSCHQNNDQLANTHDLYETLSKATGSPTVAAELTRAAENLPDPIDCSVFDLNQ